MSVAGCAELHIQMLGKHLQGFLVGQIDAVITRSECQQTVQGAGVEKIPAELAREQRSNGSLARAARPVDGDDWYRLDHEAPSA